MPSSGATFSTGTRRRFTFILTEGFSLLCVAAAIDVLRAANLVSETTHYGWAMASHDGRPVRASNGLEIACTKTLDDICSSEATFVIVSQGMRFDGHEAVLKTLRALGRRGAELGALSLGTYTLAEAGQLNGQRCTIHWEGRAAFQERFPDIELTGSLYEIDGKRYTAAGGTTGIELMLELVRADLGETVAVKVANNFQHDRVRRRDESQRSGQEPDLTGKSEKLRTVARLMAANLEEPLSAGALAASVDLSVRQVERLFLKHLGSTPGRYYMTLRLDRARQLLRQTNMAILDVAVATGFTSHSYFAQSYRSHFGRAPSEERRQTV